MPQPPAHQRPYLSVGYKLMLSYAVLIMVPVLLVGSIANSVFVGSLREQTRVNIQGTLRQMTDNIVYKMDDTRRISDMLYYDNTLGDHLYHYEEGWVSYQATKKYVLPKLQTTIAATNRKLWLSLYLHNASFREIYSNYDGADPLTRGNRLFDIYQMRRIADKDWYKHFPKEDVGKTMRWVRIEDDERYGRISLLRRLIDFNRYEQREIGFVRISVRLSDLFESVDYRKIGEGTTIYIADETGRVLSASGGAGADADAGAPQVRKSSASEEGERFGQAEAAGHLAIRQTIPELGWTILALVPTDIIERDSAKVRVLTLLVCAGCFAVFAVAGVFVSRFFSRRVRKIVSVLNSFQEGEFHKRIHFKGNDEFTRISSSLNEMGQNIGSLIREVYLKDLEKKEAELTSLQAQINPHFLYNTLSSISRLARFGQVEKLDRMVRDLAKFYRLSLSDGKNIIPVFDELEQVKAYIDIQKTKYGDRMEVLFDIDPAIVGFRIPKLTVQPFVENALEHAWRGDRIGLRIAGRLEGKTISLSVIDDGVGFHPDTVKDIFGSADNAKAGYGIRNVDQRIKLYFGRQYGVTIASRPGIGAAVRIAFPATKLKEGA